MQRVMVIGCCGAGKSTLARRLHQITKLPLIHLDQHYWKPDWTETPKSKWTTINENLAAQESWIIDGNYGGTMDIRTNRADTIIYLDYPTWKCLYRVTKRIFTYYGKRRPDMPKGCNERFDLEFMHYVATYNLVRRKSITAKLNRLSREKVIYTLRNDDESDRFLEQLNK